MPGMGTQPALLTLLKDRRAMQTTHTPPLRRADPVEAARAAIWRLFEEGHIDEDMATTSLLAIDLGTRRAQRTGQPGVRAHSAKRTRRAA
jgi:hypothetical protein